jgi:hypothetical protein
MKLFKLFTLSAVMLGTVAVSNAQEENNDRMKASIGVKGGVNFSNFTGGDSPYGSPQSRTSFHVGVIGEMPVADILSIQAEVLYSAQGAELEGLYGPTGDEVQFQLDYLSVPLLAKVYVVDGLSIEVGPTFNFVVNEEIDSRPGADEGDIDIDETSLMEANSFDVGVAAGLTFQTPGGIFATGRYNYGVTEIYEDSGLKNSVFQLGLGYKF